MCFDIGLGNNWLGWFDSSIYSLCISDDSEDGEDGAEDEDEDDEDEDDDNGEDEEADDDDEDDEDYEDIQGSGMEGRVFQEFKKSFFSEM